MNQEQVEIKTPEFVSLQFQLAGLGSRAAALIIDQLILTVVSVLVIVGMSFVEFDQMSLLSLPELSSLPIAIAIILIFLINWGYFFVVEYFSGGRTIGKKMLGIRVIQDNGHSLTVLSSLIRNLLRIIDSLPASYLVGMTMVFFHPKHKRLGDLVAGTIVVHERKGKRNKKMSSIEKEIEFRGLQASDLSIDEWTLKTLGTKEWNLLKTYSNRLLQLPYSERGELTREIATILFSKVGLETEYKTTRELENTLLILYLLLKEEWEFEL
ncbi:RDD family protein [Virgibacillus necropolis]|uniref:RDD family protein n=1 Tax=Virgibacillus necropolis TaxID=163877 RepID=UPI00384F8141